MPGVRRPAECPACAVEAKRRKLVRDEASDQDSDSQDEAIQDEELSQGDGGASAAASEVAALGACEHICKRCMECKRVLATSHLLDLHIREAHDAMFTILAEKQPMYECFDESCKEKYKTREERLKHAVDEHGYPQKFRIITKKQYNSTHPKKGNEKSKLEEMEVEKSEVHLPNPDEVKEKTKPESKKFTYSYKVPNNVCFGKGTQKGFHRPKHWHQQNRPKKDTKTDIENIDMSDLVDATWKLDT